jgi:hypothetical protein
LVPIIGKYRQRGTYGRSKKNSPFEFKIMKNKTQVRFILNIISTEIFDTKYYFSDQFIAQINMAAVATRAYGVILSSDIRVGICSQYKKL